MGRAKKGYLKFAFIFLIVLGLYFVVDYVTNLNIFPRRIHNSSDYNKMIKIYGQPVILKKSSPKMVKDGITVIPGKECKEKVFIDLSEKDNINQEKVKSDVEQNSIINEIFSNFENYVETLSKEVQVKKDTDNSSNKNSILEHVKKNKAKYFRASKYKSVLLASFRAKGRFIIIPLEEYIYQCSYPYKTSFCTYKIKNNDLIIYSHKPLSEKQIDNFLDSQSNKNNCFSWFSKWEKKRSKINQKLFFRLYTFTIPTSTTCIIINNKLILVGKNIHKKDALMRVVEKSITKI